MRRLLTRADDYGVSEGTNQAILEAIRAGLVRNVGIMVPGPALLKHLDELLDLQDKVCLGLHATLNSEWAELRWGPLAAPDLISGLVRADGSFHETVERTHCHGTPEEGIREIRKQLETVRRLGIAPQYVDCHMAFNWHPDWDRAMGEFAVEEGLFYHAHGMFPGVQIGRSDETTPDPAEVLRQMEAGHMTTAVWVFHPACQDEASARFYPNPGQPSTKVAEAREWEYRFLTDPALVRRFLAMEELVPTRYDELANPPIDPVPLPAPNRIRRMRAEMAREVISKSAEYTVKISSRS